MTLRWRRSSARHRHDIRSKSSLCANLGIALAAAIASLQAQDYPNQDVHFISAFPPGSGSDTVIRFIADKMRPLVSQPIIVENKPGAGGVIAAEYVARAKRVSQ
jgi:tripartite-type tricarboxylate transporter receptor subunit TctC